MVLSGELGFPPYRLPDYPHGISKRPPFRYFKTSPEIIRLAVKLYIRFQLLLRNVEDLLHERGIEFSRETMRHGWNRFGPMFAAEIRNKRVEAMAGAAHEDTHFVLRRLERLRRLVAVESRIEPFLNHWLQRRWFVIAKLLIFMVLQERIELSYV